jgi:ABC-2 type transport system ATP-binding protein
LLNTIDVPAALDLHREGGARAVLAQEVDRADRRRELPADQRPVLAEDPDMGCQQVLQVGLDAILLEAGINPEIVLSLGEGLMDRDEQLLASLVLDNPKGLVGLEFGLADLCHARWTHPVQWLVGPAIGVDEHRAIGLDHDHSNGLGQVRREAPDVVHGAPGDDDSHLETVPGVWKDADMGRPAIEVRGLHKAYGALKAVDDISFEVAAGECLALLGPNGAGKTTTTEILEGYRRADAGHIEVLGDNPWRASSTWKARVGIVLQADRDLGDLTVIEAVRHFARYYPNPRDPEEVIASVGLVEKSSSRNDTLSGGQRRRLDVALGIIGRPEVLFLDEPTTGFDPQARREFWVLIEALKADGTTILLTTHYLDEAERLADRVAVIAGGRVLACSTPSQLGNRGDGLAEVRWQVDGDERIHHTDQPTQFVQELSATFGGEVPQLRVHRPSLEDTYLELIGHGLADTPGGEA